MSPTALDKIDLAGCQGVNIFCSSPYYVRHALTIAARFRPLAPVICWYKSGGPVEHFLQNLNSRGLVETGCWMDTPVRYKSSRPWTLYRVRKELAAQLALGKFSFSGHCVFYEGDYPEPSLHSIIAFLSRRNRVFRFADEGHDIHPASQISFKGRIRLLSDRLAFGFRSTAHERYGQMDSYLNFFDSPSYGALHTSLVPDDNNLKPFLYPIKAPHQRPVLVLLESKDEEVTCHDYLRTLSRLVGELEERGWSIVAKGHPRLGNSHAIDDLGVPKLDQHIPLEMFDLTRVQAVLGLCSAGMLSSALAGIPTYSVEALFSRIDSTKAAWSVNFLSTHPAWVEEAPRLSFISDWKELPDSASNSFSART
jgi:hypothetical protein